MGAKRTLFLRERWEDEGRCFCFCRDFPILLCVCGGRRENLCSFSHHWEQERGTGNQTHSFLLLPPLNASFLQREKCEKLRRGAGEAKGGKERDIEHPLDSGSERTMGRVGMVCEKKFERQDSILNVVLPRFRSQAGATFVLLPRQQNLVGEKIGQLPPFVFHLRGEGSLLLWAINPPILYFDP